MSLLTCTKFKADTPPTSAQGISTLGKTAVSPAVRRRVSRRQLAASARRVGMWLTLFWVLNNQAAIADDLQAEKVYAWEFQRSEDRNVDQWPDGWRRRTGRNFPSYIPVRIAPRDAEIARVAAEAEPTLSRWWLAYQSGDYFKNRIPETTPEPIARMMDRLLVNNCLTIEMNGGAVELESPGFVLDPRFTYTLDASLATDALNGHRVWVEMLALDAQGATVGSGKTPEVTGTTDWRVVTTSSVSCDTLHLGQVIIHVAPLSPSKLTGKVSVDEIRLFRIPKLELDVDAPHHVASPNEQVDITCTVLGVHDARSNVHFQLINHLGQVVQQATAPLTPSRVVEPPIERLENKPASRAVTLTTSTTRPAQVAANVAAVKDIAGKPAQSTTQKLASKRADRADGIAHWRVNIAEPGFYRVVVDLGRTAHPSDSRQILREASLAIVENARVGVGGPFGWSLPNFDSQFTTEDVPELVKLGGVGWLKIPVWFEARETEKAEQLSLLLERLDLRKVNCVGMLDRPVTPGSAQSQHPAAAVFSSPADWEPQLEPALTRMSMKLAWFQLGRDNDHSFIGNQAIIPLITDIRNRMQAYSQDVQLALAWSYQDPLPEEKPLPWRASQMSCDPQLAVHELKSYLSDPDRPGHTRWVTINPLPASRYRTLDRVRDLTERMIAVKQHKVEAAFITTPLSDETGIFNSDGSVGDMFLPWRLLNQNLAAATFLGSVNLPGGSTNYCFSEGDSGFMLLWNDRTAVEQLYLGDDVKATDVWGRPVALEQTRSQRDTPEQKLIVTPWPVLLTGINVSVANWRMRFKLETKKLPSTIAQQAALPIAIENTLGQTAFGSVTLVAPTLLSSRAAEARLQLIAGEQQHANLPAALRNDASAGKHALRFDFDLSGDKDYAFSAYETLTLGIGDVELHWETIEVTGEQAALRVEVTNKTNRPVSFDCKLFPPQQPYRRLQIMNAPPGHTFRDLVLPLTAADPDAVLWIRCEEMGTGRVLNYRVPLTGPEAR